MYARALPPGRAALLRSPIHRRLRKGPGDGDRDQVTTGEVSEADSGGQPAAAMPVTLDTHAFGQITGHIGCRSTATGIAWAPNLVFPASGPSERLVRHTRVPKRAPILARDGTPLAEGPATARTSPLGAAAQSVAGEVSSPTPSRTGAVAARVPARARRPAPAASSWRSTVGSPGGPGGQLVAVPAQGGARRAA